MKKLIKIGIVQTKITNDLNFNLNHALEMTEKAAQKGAEIICLPELYKTPYFPQKEKVEIKSFWESIPGESTEAFKKISKKYHCSIILPIYEKTKNGKFYNSITVLNEKGEIQPTYRKLHIPHDPSFYEKNYFRLGNNGYVIYKHKNVKYAVLICFDQWFPEAARVARLEGAELIFYPTAIGNIIGNKPKDGNWHEAWETVMRGHSIANSLPIIAVNRTGIEDKLDFWGQSFVTDSFGKVINRAKSDKEEIIITTLDLSMNKIISEDWGFMRNRRPDTYKKITNKIK